MKKQLLMVRVLLSETLTLKNSCFKRAFCSSSSSSSFPIKNVTKSNFKSSFNDLRGLVRGSDFVAIDLEMTGVTSAPWRDSLEFDRSDILYLKVKDSAEKFAVVQFGVCPFRWDPRQQSFIAHPHNFYVFPRQEITADGSSNEFLCQTSSIDFLAKYQFDFNMCINEGISYISRTQEDAARRRLYSAFEAQLSESARERKEVSDTSLDKVADVLFTLRMKKQISEWLNGLSRVWYGEPECQDSTGSNQKFQTIFFNTHPALKLNGFTSHQLRLIQSVTDRHFRHLVYIRLEDETSCLQHLLIYADSENDMDLLKKEVKESLRKEAEMKIEAAIGFRHVIDLLSSEQKLIVGHNCFLDLAHIYNKFLGSLPMTVEEYVPHIQKYFPYVIDTKILLNANPTFQSTLKKGSTSLSKAFAALCLQTDSDVKVPGLSHKPRIKVEVQVDDMRSSNWNSGAKHEAGYDAFMTGSVFAQACSQLGIEFKRQTPLEWANEEMLQKHINLLYLSWTCGGIVDLRTGKLVAGLPDSKVPKIQDPNFSFPNIALVWGFQSVLKTRDIRECLCKAFGPTSVTTVYKLDETAVFVHFIKPELVSDFLDTIERLKDHDDPIAVVHPLSKLLEGGQTFVANYEVYKEICSSSISKILFSDQADTVMTNWKTKLLEEKVKVEGDSPNKSETANMEIKARPGSDMPREELSDSFYVAEAQAEASGV